MAKFSKRGGTPSGPGGEGERKKSGRSAYKAKRSFTRNKSSRGKEKSGDDRPAFRERDTAFRDRPFKTRDRKERSGDDKPARRYNDDKRPAKEERGSSYRDKPYHSRDKKERGGDDRPARRFSDDKRPGKEESSSLYRDKPFHSRDKKERDGDDRPARRYNNDKRPGGDDRPKRSYSDREKPERKPWRESREREERPSKDDKERPRRSFSDDSKGSDRDDNDRKTGRRSEERTEAGRSERSGRRFFEREKPARGPSDRDNKDRRSGTRRDDDGIKRRKFSDFEEPENFRKEGKQPPPKKTSDDGLIRLNKYLSNAGVASRREADDLIQSGAVKVNGVVVDQLGYKIKPGDKVTYGDESVRSEKKVYLLLNKPKDYITTVDDPRGRKTVMELIAGAARERLYPVGRLDRNTTGLLLFTNDGELTTKLTHPKYNVKKVYHVTLDKSLKTTDFKALVDGIELEDGPVKADDLAFVGEGKKDIGIEIHSGKNRVVRRMFEHLGYKVVKLDRVVFAGLTKKDLPRGKHRFLTPKEVAFLKMLG